VVIHFPIVRRALETRLGGKAETCPVLGMPVVAAQLVIGLRAAAAAIVLERVLPIDPVDAVAIAPERALPIGPVVDAVVIALVELAAAADRVAWGLAVVARTALEVATLVVALAVAAEEAAAALVAVLAASAEAVRGRAAAEAPPA
jgi:hypothetical protein